MRTAGRTRIKLPAGRCHAVGWVGDTEGLEPDGVTHAPVTPISLTSNGSGKSHSVVPQGTAPSGDASESGPRSIAAQDDPTPFSGVAVTATNSDDIAAVGVSAGFSGTAAVNLSGAVAVVTANTSAYIGKNAMVNCGVDCTTDPGTGESVRVSAGNQFPEGGIAATLAIGGSVGGAAGVGVPLITLAQD